MVIAERTSGGLPIVDSLKREVFLRPKEVLELIRVLNNTQVIP